mmetsp:Transcript_16953/g.39502  ORF Transcript_16953/g.39502 Transcript_16953/m.39502 type:complete len:481 (-) Transcript_16953:69-1511(-)
MEAAKALLLVLNFISVLLFSGIIFGWTALRDILIKEKFYAHLCDDPDATLLDGPCANQMLALNSAFTIASAATSLFALPGGMLLDAAGPLVTVIVAGIFNVVSIFGVAMCEGAWRKSHVDIFPFMFVVMGMAGSLIRFCGYSCAFLFPEHKTLLIAMASVLFDGSCLVFPVIKVLYISGLSFETLFWIYTILSAIVFMLLPVAWYMNREEAHRVRAEELERKKASANASFGLASQPIHRQLLTLEFAVILLFSSFELTHSNLYIGTVNGINERIAREAGMPDADAVNVNTIVSFIIPLGFMAVPAITCSAKRYGPAGALQVSSLLALAFTALQLVPILYLQLLTVCFFAAFRAFLFSTVPAYNSHYFGVLRMGRMQGFCFVAGGLLNFSQKPLVAWTVQTLDGDYTPLLLISLTFSTLLLLPTTLLRWRERQRNSLRQPLTGGVTLPNGSLSTNSLGTGGSALMQEEAGVSMEQQPTEAS